MPSHGVEAIQKIRECELHHLEVMVGIPHATPTSNFEGHYCMALKYHFLQISLWCEQVAMALLHVMNRESSKSM